MATTQPAYNSAENSVATAPSTDRFTDRLWAETKALRESIDSLEFLRRLGDGTLPLDAFRTYIEQDKLYLEGYSKALSLVAGPCPGSAVRGLLVEFRVHGSDSGICASRRTSHRWNSSSGIGKARAFAGLPGIRLVSDGDCSNCALPGLRSGSTPLLLDLRRGRPRSCRFSARGTRRRFRRIPYAQWVTTYDAPEFHESVAQARVLVDAAGRSCHRGRA